MKIVYCIAGLYNPAGMERIISAKANYLSKVGNEVIIITAEQRGRIPFFKLSDNIQTIDLGINYSITSNFFLKLLLYPFKRIKHQWKLCKVLKGIKPDITISTMGNEFLFLYRFKDGSKKIAEIHFSKEYRVAGSRNSVWLWRDMFRSKQEENKLKKYDAFITLTHEDLGYWKGFNNIEVIPNFINQAPVLKSYEMKKRFICVGRLSYQKGYDLLIEASRLIKEDLKGWHIDIFGSGPLENQVKEQIEESGLQEIIRLNPPKADISQEYLNSDALLLPSRYEGLPMVILEAMSVGLPVISFACPCGPRDIIKNKFNGVLVEKENVGELANAIKDFINWNFDIEYMGRNAIIESSKYNIDAIMSKWQNLFSLLIRNN